MTVIPPRSSGAIVPPQCVACRNPMTLITTIADPLLKRVRLFECTKCRNTAFIKET
jgi:hypothetical protein